MSYFKVKCSKFDFGRRSATDPLAGFKGPASNGKGLEGRVKEDEEFNKRYVNRLCRAVGVRRH